MVPMLSDEQIAFLTWLDKQSEKVCMSQMAEMSAPGFASERVEKLRTEGLIDRDIGFHQEKMVGIYCISDKGKAFLSEIEKAEQKASADIRQQRFQNQVSVAQVLVPFITFVLGLVVEHYSCLIGAMFELLR